MSEAKMCSKCVLTDKMPNIEFDEKGVCNYCNSHEKIQTKPEKKFRKILDNYRTKNNKYDCMIGLSGGRDSTYVLWKLVNDYKMKVLAVTYDNPFMSEQAKKNIDNTVSRLDIDLVKWGFKEGEHKKATKKYLKIWSKKPSSILIPLVCAHCKSWWPGFFKIAKENNIKLIVIGSNPLETASFKKKGLGGARTYHRFTNIPRILYKTIREVVKNPRYLTTSWRMVLRMYLGASHSTPYMKWRYKDIHVERLFDFFRWDEKEVESTIKKNLGWKKSPEVESSWRFDCRLDYARRLMYAATVGSTELRDLFSKMIRENVLTREEALKRLKNEEPVKKEVVNDVLGAIDLKLDDLHLKGIKNLVK